ncbi:MAG: hypothetical protein B7Y39_17300 [Bdellovibrio sp. 28-41-41]|nr:MAG: hypothetical protein B7Y39_17300 [Bdellovibrio sp. 28-41-41]
MSKFFAVTAPGFEEGMEAEIKKFHSLFGIEESLKILSTQKGGVEFESAVSESVYFNNYSKLATRVLIRWDEFHCVFFSDLEKKLKQRSLSKWFKNKSRIFVKVNSKKSKLGQEKKIFEVFKRVYVDFELIPKASEAEEDDFTLFVDFFEDGSMRETIASWALTKMMTVDSPWKEPTILIDPFAGSGTLLLESQNVGINRQRDYAYQKLKAFVDLKPLNEQKIDFSKFPFAELVGIESDEETFEILKSNLQALAKKTKVSLYHQKNEDFKETYDQRVWIFSNLPYGKQVKSETLKSMFATMKSVFKPQMIAVFHPEPLKDNEAQSVLHLPVVNGGLKVTLSILIYKK